jgi:biopolymer transport protein ExbD
MKSEVLDMAGSKVRFQMNYSPDINVTPLIDVLLVLLIIFMVITPLTPSRLESRIPDKTPSDYPTAVSSASVIRLKADPAGRISEIRLNEQRVTVDQLVTMLQQQLDRQPSGQKVVFIQAPRQTIYREVVNIIDQAKQAGASPIGLQIDDLPVS